MAQHLTHSTFKDIVQHLHSKPDSADPYRKKINFCQTPEITFFMSLGTVSNETKGQHTQNPSGTPFHKRTTLLKEKSKAPALSDQQSLMSCKYPIWSNSNVSSLGVVCTLWSAAGSHLTTLIQNSFWNKQLAVNWNTQIPFLLPSPRITDNSPFSRKILLHRPASFTTFLPSVM